jgi:DNA-binding transcriptional LysR family regulator
MQTKQLEYFIAVAEELSFTRAAKRLFISQAALSMQVKALEKELGTQLLERDRHHVALTAAGEVYLGYAREIVARADEAAAKARSATEASVGELRVGYVKGYERSGLSHMIANFHREHPRVWLSFTRDNVAKLYDALRAEKLDVVINLRYPDSHMGDIEWQDLQHYPLVAVLPFDHPLAHRTSIDLEELRGYPSVMYMMTPSNYGEVERIEALTRAHGIYEQVSCAAEDIETSILCVLAGMGYALLPGFIVPTLSSESRIVAVPIRGMEHEITIAAAWLPQTGNELIDVFLDEFLEIGSDV